MKQSLRQLKRLVIISTLLLGSIVFPVVALAAPIHTTIIIAVSSAELVPGQAGFVSITGSYPLDVIVLRDGEPQEVFWTGREYVSIYAAGLDATAGEFSLQITVQSPDTVLQEQLTTTIKVQDYKYPLEQLVIPFKLLPLLDQTLNDNELQRLQAIYLTQSNPPQWDWPFFTPVQAGVITSRYGGDRVYNAGMLFSRHTGMDFRRAIGEPVLSAAAGQVVLAELLDIRGNVVIIDHGHGVFSQYAHLDEFAVQEGQWVEKAQILGLAGATGRTNGPHLHFEIIVQGYTVDPLKWFQIDPGFITPREFNPSTGK